MRFSGLKDLYFVVASGLLCLFLCLWVVEPRVRRNQETRQKLQTLIAETQSIATQTLGAHDRASAIRRGDSFLRRAVLRWYLELEDLPWQDTPEELNHARHSEPGRGGLSP